MSRSHARIVTTIWIDQDWRQLNAAAQWLYMTILTQPDLSYAGTLSVNVGKWAKMASGTTPGDIQGWLRSLADARFVVLDEDSDELMVRSFIRNDGVAKQPKILMSACRSARTVVSDLIRAELAFELSRIERPKYEHAVALLDETVAELAPGGVPSESPSKARKGFITDPERVNDSSGNPRKGFQQNPKWKGLINLPETPGGGGGGGGYCSSKSTTLLTPSKKREEENQEFQAFCEAYPKDIPQTQRIELAARWQAASNAHGADRMLKAAQRYTSAMDAAGTERKFAKNPVVWLKDGLFVEHLPDELEPYQGMDVVAWLDEVTARRDVNTAKRYATGDDYLPEWPAEYEGWTAAEVEAFRESDKDRWFREHRALHIEVLSRRYGGASDVA